MTAELALSDEKKAFLEAEVTPHLTGHEQLVTPRCPVFDSCGGCHLQHLSYPDQLAVKRRLLEHCFRSRGLAHPSLDGRVFGMDDPWYYRNKADFNAKTYAGQLKVGLTALGANRVLDVDECAIASRRINESLAGFRTAFPDYPELKRKLHSLILRSSRVDDNVVALYHTKLKDAAVFNRLTAQVREQIPALAGGGFVRRGKDVGEGPFQLHENIRGMDYRYSASSFFQANPLQTEVLARLVEEAADPRPSDVVLDVYSGVGLFTLLIAQSVREVYAIEDTPRSVKDAIENARLANITNCRFLKGQADEQLEHLYRTRVQPTLAILDPPRSGCAESVLNTIRQLAVPRVVFVSCNPKSLARDVEIMVAGGYKLESLAVVDMFPQTIHLESVAYLTL
jgi:23S rRNA (uracil1939-C5)-methyltransferase